RDFFGLELAGILALNSIVALFGILFALPIGFAADRWNRTRMTAAGALTWGVFSFMTAFAANPLMLGIARFGSGLGKTLDPAHSSLLADYYPPDVRPGVFAVHRMSANVAAILGP